MKSLPINLGELIASGYSSKSIKQELRDNLIKRLQSKEPIFDGIVGYDDTVIPDVTRAILSKHNFILLGLRGQAKTRIARLMVELLDEYIPFVEGSELNDCPLHPISTYAKDLIAEKGNKTPISWLHKSERFAEKLATPDVSIADLIGDIDPIKAVNLKVNYNDEKAIHYGIIPRSHRSIFVINELPDLQARIQVALFNILQEGDIQIRGFKLRLPLDVMFVFTANPEDYTNRGSIVTPLKDRIESQILTHYPKNISDSIEITQQEVRLSETQKQIGIHNIAKELVEQIAFEARNNEYVDAKSGVSARLTISAYENLMSTAELRMLQNAEKSTFIRVSDFQGAIPSITGKVELVYEGEQEGNANVARMLINNAIRSTFKKYFDEPINKKKKATQKYQSILDWFSKGNNLELYISSKNKEYNRGLDKVTGLRDLARESKLASNEDELFFIMEFILHALAEYSLINRNIIENSINFGDLLTEMFNFGDDIDEGGYYEDE